MIVIHCIECGKEIRVSGADFKERNANKIKPVCFDCSAGIKPKMIISNKNIQAVRSLIRCLSTESLKNPEVVANLVRAFGIVQWGPPVFGQDEAFKNQSVDMAGIYQTPGQIGKALVYLSKFKINSYLEIGVFQGGNFVFVSEYLKRFNPEIKCYGIDPTNFLNPEIKEIIESEKFMSFKSAISDQIKGTKFDLVFIDGDHSAEWIKRDFENVGKLAKICMFHDIQEKSCPDVKVFWDNLDGNKIEFLDSNAIPKVQGIGILHKKGIK